MLEKNAIQHKGSPAAVALKYWSLAQLNAVSAVVAAALSSWRQAWAMREPGAADQSITCVNLGAGHRHARALAYWQPLHQDEVMPRADAKTEHVSAVRAWLRFDAHETASADLRSGPEVLHQALFGETAKATALSSTGVPTGEIAAEIVDAAWRDLLAKLSRALHIPAQAADLLPQQALPSPDSKLWQGAVQIELPWHGRLLCLHLNAACVAAMVPARQALLAVPAASPPPALMPALAQQVLSVSVQMTPLEISIGDLQSLRINDVVLLPHRLDQAVLVGIKDGRDLACGFLGKSRGNWAIEWEANAEQQSLPSA